MVLKMPGLGSEAAVDWSTTEASVPSAHRPRTMTITAVDGFGFGAVVNLRELISRYLCRHVGTLAGCGFGSEAMGRLSSIEESVPSLCQHRGRLIL